MVAVADLTPVAIDQLVVVALTERAVPDDLPGTVRRPLVDDRVEFDGDAAEWPVEDELCDLGTFLQTCADLTVRQHVDRAAPVQVDGRFAVPSSRPVRQHVREAKVTDALRIEVRSDRRDDRTLPPGPRRTRRDIGDKRERFAIELDRLDLRVDETTGDLVVHGHDR